MICGVVIECNMSNKHIMNKIKRSGEKIDHIWVRQYTDEEIDFYLYLEKIGYPNISKYRAFDRMNTLKMMSEVDVCVLVFNHLCYEMQGIAEVVRTFNKKIIMLSSDAAKTKSWRSNVR